jgi:P-type E1-E2 ATPase
MPREVKEGDHVFAGTINLMGTITCRVLHAQGETRIDDIRRAVEHALSQKSPIERLADRVSSVFVPAVMGIALVAGGVAFALGLPVGVAISRAVAVLVIACPCALGLATPVAMMVELERCLEV